MRSPRHLAFAAAALVALAPSMLAAGPPAQEVDELATQWIALQHQRDALLANWRRDKPVQQQQLDLLDREGKALGEVLAQSAKQQDQVEQRRLELLEQQTKLEQEQALLTDGLGRIAASLHALQPQLPPPLVAAWDRDLPKLDDVERSASERLQITLGLLGRLADFQQKVTVNETVMTLGDGQQHVVKQIYLGLGQGWYVSADLKYAAVGTPGVDGWRWTASDGAAAIDRALSILERKRSPELVTVPARLATAAEK